MLVKSRPDCDSNIELTASHSWRVRSAGKHKGRDGKTSKKTDVFPLNDTIPMRYRGEQSRRPRNVALRLIPITASFVCTGRAIVDCVRNDETKWVREWDWWRWWRWGVGSQSPGEPSQALIFFLWQLSESFSRRAISFSHYNASLRHNPCV